jgi:hypothetical protein
MSEMQVSFVNEAPEFYQVLALGLAWQCIPLLKFSMGMDEGGMWN